MQAIKTSGISHTTPMHLLEQARMIADEGFWNFIRIVFRMLKNSHARKRVLEMRGLLYTGPRTILHNLRKTVERAGVQVENIIISPLAMTKSKLSLTSLTLSNYLLAY